MPITLNGSTGVNTPGEVNTGDLSFSGTGQRITGDFSNATQTNRLFFQSSTTNGITAVGVLPNGTAASSFWTFYPSSDPSNTGYGYVAASTTEVTVRSVVSGTGTYLPMTFFTGGSESARIDTAGNVVVTGGGGLGYGTGSGGTVTQATSKSTAVTLNKPTGQITMNNAALGAGVVISFTLNNSLLTAADTMVLHVNGGTANAANYQLFITNFATGSCAIAVKNTSAGSLSEALVINFAVIKGATA